MSKHSIIDLFLHFKIFLNQKLNNFLQKQWLRNSWLSIVLRPFSFLIAFEAKRRYSFFKKKRGLSFRPNVPVIIIGNIYIGGTGKTPLVIAAAIALKVRGWTPGILSRGYGVKIGNYPRVGMQNLSNLQFGDESTLISRATGAPISIHPKRELAAKALLCKFPKIDVIISDDGLQYFSLDRDLEIIVQDERGIGNGLTLPAGPLREPSNRLNEAYAIVTNNIEPYRKKHKENKNFRYHLDMWLEITHAKHVKRKHSDRPILDFASKSTFLEIVAAAGIGNPKRFFTSLKTIGINLAFTLDLPDHYHFSHSPFKNISADIILVTSKDSVKCSNLNDDRLWEVPAIPRFSDPYFFDHLSHFLKPIKNQL